jgi:hypothetical protein
VLLQVIEEVESKPGLIQPAKQPAMLLRAAIVQSAYAGEISIAPENGHDYGLELGIMHDIRFRKRVILAASLGTLSSGAWQTRSSAEASARSILGSKNCRSRPQ